MRCKPAASSWLLSRQPRCSSCGRFSRRARALSSCLRRPRPSLRLRLQEQRSFSALQVGRARRRRGFSGFRGFGRASRGFGGFYRFLRGSASFGGFLHVLAGFGGVYWLLRGSVGFCTFQRGLAGFCGVRRVSQAAATATNPVDLLAAGGPAGYAAALSAVLADEQAGPNAAAAADPVC